VEISIPDGEIIPNDRSVIVRDDPAQIAYLSQLTDVYGYLADGTRYESDMIDIRLTLDGELVTCSVVLIREPRPTLVVTLPGDAGTNTDQFLLLRDDTIDPGQRNWSFSSRLLVLPMDIEYWAPDDAGFEQRDGRILLFAGLANINRWFRPGPVEALPGA
jgi:hypothetical protein